jgi:hypothetical protein
VNEPSRVIAFPRRPQHETLLTYRQLAPELKVSVRFLQYRAKEGMPDAGFDYAGHKLFRLSEVVAYLDARQQRLGRTMPDARSPQQRGAS